MPSIYALMTAMARAYLKDMRAREAECRMQLRAQQDPELAATLTAFLDLLESLMRSISNAIKLGRQLSPGDVPLTAARMEEFLAGAQGDRDRARRRGLVGQLTDQRVPGFGSPIAEVIIGGMEAAYNTDHPLPYALEACGLTIQTLSGGSAAISAHMAGEQTWAPRRSFMHHPYDLYRESINQEGHTFRKMAKLMLWAYQLPLPSPRLLLDYQCPIGLGDLTYWFDLSSHPATNGQDDREDPTEERLQFLESLLAILRLTAKVLILHGDSAWHPFRERLTRTFLALAPGADIPWVTRLTADGRTFDLAVQGHQIVVRSRFLGMAASSNAYLTSLAETIRPFLTLPGTQKRTR